MQVETMRDLSSLVRSTRLSRGLTQAELAARLGVSRDWVVRLEQAGTRLEVQKVLDVLVVLGLQLDVHEAAQPSASSSTPAPRATAAPEPPEGKKPPPNDSTPQGRPAKNDPFAFLTKRT
ncbi:helix-turn-helix domain-containing protein [Nocardioides plantarum]|uniref:Helix-turn-helix domain-containing protein n=1 Tax=Nocardioides plantarum TaxID=29299 RepID=A0ABV5KBN6_9ACTN|nr:helix-turn-helix domain-containing protein [Nocardioides plantarum]